MHTTTATDDRRYIHDFTEDDAPTLEALLEIRRDELAQQQRNEEAQLGEARRQAQQRFEAMLRENIAPALYNALSPIVRWADDGTPAGGSLQGHAEATFSAFGMTWVIARLGAWYLYGPYGYRRISSIDAGRSTLFILDALNDYPAWRKEHEQKEREQQEAKNPKRSLFQPLPGDFDSEEVPF